MIKTKLNIIYEDKNIVVLDKPAGLLTHPTDKKEKDALTDKLIEYYPEIKNVGASPRPGIVHRLDKDTSGLIIAAKNNKAYNYLKEQFKKRLVKKEYLALVAGKLKEKTGIITKPITRSKREPSKRTVGLWGKWKKAITRYEVIKEFKNYSLLKVMLETGRMHQIRVHLASIGHPVAGDKIYKFKRQTAPKGLKRQFLHASFLNFKLPDGKKMTFYSKLPQDLQKTLNELD